MKFQNKNSFKYWKKKNNKHLKIQRNFDTQFKQDKEEINDYEPNKIEITEDEIEYIYMKKIDKNDKELC